MPPLEAPRTGSVRTGSSTDDSRTAIASRPASEYRMTFGCSLDAGPSDVQEGGVSRED